MSKWSSFEKDRLLMESWRQHVNEEPEKVEELFGFGKAKWEKEAERQAAEAGEEYSRAKPQDVDVYAQGKLENILQSIRFLSSQQKTALMDKMAELADDEGIMLEAVTLTGSQSEQDRVFSAESTQELMGFIQTLGLEAAQTKQLLKALNQWAKMNTIKFATAAAGAAPQPEPDPEPEPEAEEEKRNIMIFRGKGGKGIQSLLAKAGIQGKDMSRILKGLRADLTAAGFNVLEEASKQTISLDNTLAALAQVADPAQKEAARGTIVTLLRQHNVRLDRESGAALRSGPTSVEAEWEDDKPEAAAAPEGPVPIKAPFPPTAPGQEGALAARARGHALGGGAPPTGRLAHPRRGEEEEEEKSRKLRKPPEGSWTKAMGGIREEKEVLNFWHKLAGIIKE